MKTRTQQTRDIDSMSGYCATLIQQRDESPAIEFPSATEIHDSLDTDQGGHG